ncbi:uncharacterized protein CTRU02_215466 [Colletotrichum truncatum]|uniref:Uncharacterized protein n=1 Tax=Colletotrichum truncatum TaxID=5467 RepID=A0ACC3YCN5_COLTU|nr:uncharacterized protein CTRU02_05591 [Colletotrichum truncatum]KAF6794034.1 hypothetical protein CTRU02_05591 [Colletotrichum truncatum]
MLRRAPFLQGDCEITHVRALPAVYAERHPKDDHKRARGDAVSWIGVHRGYFKGPHSVVVKEVPHMTIACFRTLARSSHPNIVQLFGLYLSDSVYITYELVDLNLFDLRITSELEVAAVMSQLLHGIKHLQDLPMRFGVRSIRVSPFGVVKIVPEFETSSYPGLALALSPKIAAAFLQCIMEHLGASIPGWSDDALDFLKILESGHQPDDSVCENLARRILVLTYAE